MFFGAKRTLARFLAALLAIGSACLFLTHTARRIPPTTLLSDSQTVESAPLTVVIDAGHGGEDGGAVSAGGALEKDLNLSVAFYLCDLLKANGVNVIMTRTDDRLLYDKTANYIGRKKALDLAARQKIAEDTGDCLFVSIHMNAYPLPQYGGLQVWYSPNHAQSETLAASIRDVVRSSLQPQNDREIKRASSSIYLLHHLNCPAVLVECGFLSNPSDAELLASPDYQRQLALAILCGIMQGKDA